MLEKIRNTRSLDELSAMYADVFGKNGTLTLRLKTMKDLSPDERAAVNVEKDTLATAFKEQQTVLEDKAMMASLSRDALDATLSPLSRVIGKLHPLTKVLGEIEHILSSMGYALKAGPEIEDDFHNFTALNTPQHHPARDMQDTFFVAESLNVLRTQTSAMQIRAMEAHGAPIKVFVGGATYRREMDATHSPMFHQIEGLCVDKNVTLTDMISDIKTFLSRFFALDIVPLRIRPSYFPFTEPSLEVDIQWDKKTGKLGTGSDWLEIMGAGMVHPDVLRNSGVDPNVYQGFAFGFGWDRLVMLKYGLNDIRKFYEGDVRWITANGF